MPRKKPIEPPFKDPFRYDAVQLRLDKPEPGLHEKRFFYYYYRPAGKMIVHFGTESHVVNGVDTRGLDTWTVEHTIAPLKYLVSGNARRMFVHKGIAMLS